MDKRLWILLLLLVAGCATPPPAEKFRLINFSIRSADAETNESVRIDFTCPFRHAVRSWTNIVVDAENVYVTTPWLGKPNGNVYRCEYTVRTNYAVTPPDGTNWVEVNTYIATNRMPVRRMNVELSLDGGTNYSRRLAFGIQCNPDRLGGDFMWSPPSDHSMLSEHAVLRLTDLDGKAFDNGPTNMPGTRPPGAYVTTLPFPIRGAYVSAPAAGAIVYAGADMTVSFFETGGGPTWDIGWLTEADPYFHPITTASNVVGGIVNTSAGLCTIPVAPEVRLGIWSHADRALKGYSSTFSVE